MTRMSSIAAREVEDYVDEMNRHKACLLKDADTKANEVIERFNCRALAERLCL